jgi:hypothetical protein
MVVIAHRLRTIGSRTAATVRHGLMHIRQSIAESRLNKVQLESELYRGCYGLRSKTDDDLPIVR